jgi:glucose/mannose-6-phosphate isomerase
MNLDEFHDFRQLDLQDMLTEIDSLPAQLESAWGLGQNLPLPIMPGLKQIIICGMGGSAIAADLLSAYTSPLCSLPVFIHRDYGLPAWAKGPETLVIASSHSGNTEETLDSFEQALQNKCILLAVTTGGDISVRASQADVPVWIFQHAGQPRAAVGYSFGLLLALFDRLKLIPSQANELAATVAAMKSQQQNLRAEVPVSRNSAKRLAGQLVGRWINIYGSGLLAPVARRWKTQDNEIAKAGAGFEALPESDHNALAGLINPAEELAHTFTLFLQARSDHPRNHLRSNLTRQEFMKEGLNTDIFVSPGGSPLADIWTTLHFGDYTAYYLAMCYNVDPTPVQALESFKAAIKSSR